MAGNRLGVLIRVCEFNEQWRMYVDRIRVICGWNDPNAPQANSLIARRCALIIPNRLEIVFYIVLQIMVDDRAWIAGFCHPSALEPYEARTQAAQGRHVMADENNRATC